jgi:hypothetical protein
MQFGRIYETHSQELQWTSEYIRNSQPTMSTIITKTGSEDEMGMALQFVSYVLFPGAMKISYCLVHHPNNKKHIHELLDAKLSRSKLVQFIEAK